jgi:arylsulfatase A-like enzyme
MEEPGRLVRFRDRIPSGAGAWDEKKWRYYLWHYYRYVEGVDCEIKRLLDTLEETGMDKNTIVLFASDHGENAAGHRTVLKTTLYNESCKVPFMLKIPEAERGVSDVPVSLMDILPTLCELCYIDPPDPMTGKSLSGLIKNGKSPKRPGIPVESYNGEGRAYIWKGYKYIAFNDGDTPQLFNLEEDPHETRNLAEDKAYADVLVEIRKSMADDFAKLEKAECLPSSSSWEEVLTP